MPKKRRNPAAAPSKSKALARSRRITRRAARRWHKQDGKKASKRKRAYTPICSGPFLVDLTLAILDRYLPPKLKPAPKSKQIGKENPCDVVIDVKPEGIE